MGTALRGYGWYKWDLLRSLYVEFELGLFTYAAAAKLSQFDRKTFISLRNDGWLVNKGRTGRISQWKLSTAAVSVLFGNNVPDEITLESGIKSRSPRCSKRLLLESELFFKQVLEAVEFFSKPEVRA